MMDNVHMPSNSECYTPSSEPCKMYMNVLYCVIGAHFQKFRKLDYYSFFPVFIKLLETLQETISYTSFSALVAFQQRPGCSKIIVLSEHLLIAETRIMSFKNVNILISHND
jgi:hypothetical protein